VLGGSDVVADQLAPHGEVEGGTDDLVDLEDGLGGAAVTVLAAGGGEVAVELFEVVDPEAS
jgi:hypothetical protein